MTRGVGTETDVPVAASWGARFGAWFFDVVIVFVGPLAVAAIAVDGAGADSDAAVGITYGVGFLSILLMPIYFALFHAGRRGQTIGKRATGVAVRDARTGGRLGYGRAFGRAYLMFALYAFGFVGLVVDCLWPLWDKRKQALHDKAVNSMVVRQHAAGRW